MPLAALAAAAAALAAQSTRASQTAGVPEAPPLPSVPLAVGAGEAAPPDMAGPEGLGRTHRERRTTRVSLLAGVAGITALAAILTIASLHGDSPTKPNGSAAPATGPAHPAGAPSSVGPTSGAPTAGRPGTKGSPGAHTPGPRTAGKHSSTTIPGGKPSSGEGNGGTLSPNAASSPAVNLAAPAGFGTVLRQVWVAADPGHVALSTADVESTLPGTVFYAEQPSIGTYWAVSSFVPSAQAESGAGTATGNALLAQFATVAVFDKVPGHGWAFFGSVAKGGCSSTVPGPVYSVWGVCGTHTTTVTTGS